MKKIYCCTILFCFLAHPVFCQDILVFRGTVKCFISDDVRSTRGAKNVVVVPGFIPKKSGMTGSQGYYELNTGVPIKMLNDKYVTVYYISSCNKCEKKENVFISSDQVSKSTTSALAYITIPTVKMNAGCKNTELGDIESDRVLNSFTSQQGEDLSKVTSLNVVTAPPGLLNLLTNVVNAPPILGGGLFIVNPDSTIRSNINSYGKFLFASPMILTANTGFNFSPYRESSEAVFWNPAVLAGRDRKADVSLFTNFKNNVKLAGSCRINDFVTIGAGVIYTKQDAFQQVQFVGPSDIIVQHLQILKEYAVFLPASFKLSEKWSAGITLKSIWQSFNQPDKLFVQGDLASGNLSNEFTDNHVKQQRFDADISFSYIIAPALKAGINIMNIAGSELYSDVSSPRAEKMRLSQLRSLGLGLCYRWKQFNFGSDALFTGNGLYDVSVGINYVPFNNALLSAGYVFRQKGFTAGFKWKQFKTSYVNDNDLMASEKKPGKSKLFNGRIYTGVAFDF